MTICMYEKFDTGRLCLATYIAHITVEALSSIVNDECIFHDNKLKGRIGFYYTNQNYCYPHDKAWIVKYGHNDYMIYTDEDFQDKFSLIQSVNLNAIQKYLAQTKKTNKFVAEEMLNDIKKLTTF